MEKNNSFQPIGKRLDNLNKKLKTDYPEDIWVMKNILDAFLSIIDSSSSLEQQRIVSKELNRLLDAYEFRYNTILETTIMTNEQLRMQMLSGIITEGEYKSKLQENKKSTKKSLKENFVGLGAINNPFIKREKTGYETAFEHFLGEKYELKEEMEEVEEGNLYHNEMYSIEPEGRFWIVTYTDMNGEKEKVFQSEDEAREFASTLDEGKEVEEPNNY
jgi:hypothetical protein